MEWNSKKFRLSKASMIRNNVLRAFITLLMPVFALSVSVLLFTLPLFFTLAYGRSSYPPDWGGWEASERLEYGHAMLRYLRSWGNSEANLVDLQLDTETIGGEPLFTRPELDHLVDIKKITDATRIIAIASFMALSVSIYSLKDQQLKWRAVRMGGVSVFISPLILGFFGLFTWKVLFSKFHELLFPEDSYSFDVYLPIVRLFPPFLAQDALMALVIVMILIGLFTIALTTFRLRRLIPGSELQQLQL